MRQIQYNQVVNAVKSMCIDVNYQLAPDVLSALAEAAEKETNVQAREILKQLIENAQIATAGQVPMCQDTGLAVLFVEQGCEVIIEADPGKTLVDAINQAVAQGYEAGFLRKSVVAEPLNQRKNTGTNTPAIIHHFVVPGDKLKISLMAKGGGCENKSQFKMFNPTADKQDIVDWVVEVVWQAGANACPPFIVGVGIGGNFELSCLLSKKALLRELNVKNSDEFYEKLEADILYRINALGLGPQGLGGDTTALACLIEQAPCHIASLPVAVNIECHSHRYKTIII